MSICIMIKQAGTVTIKPKQAVISTVGKVDIKHSHLELMYIA